MRYLVVYAHPVEDSYCAALNKTVCDALIQAGHEVDNIDLYAEGFEAVLSRQERQDYHTRDVNLANVKNHVDRLKAAEGLIFVFPTWWYSLPAILKGWLDRVWVPHVTFTLPDNGEPIRPLMQHIRHVGGVTTCGAPWLWSKIVGEPARKIILRGIKVLCHKPCKSTWLAMYKMDESTPQQRVAYLRKVEKRFLSL